MDTNVDIRLLLKVSTHYNAVLYLDRLVRLSGCEGVQIDGPAMGEHCI